MSSIFIPKKSVNTFDPWLGCSASKSRCQSCMVPRTPNAQCQNFSGMGPRAIESKSHWGKPLQWNRQALRGGANEVEVGAAYCDWTDLNVPDGQRERLLDMIRQTPNLMWNLTTQNASEIEVCLPNDWGRGYENVSLGIAVEDSEQGSRSINILRKTPATLRHA